MKDDGGRAFPLSRESEGWYEPGMTLRDWFAGKALGEMIRAERQMADDEKYKPERIAKWAYEVADSMLEARAPLIAEQENSKP